MKKKMEKEDVLAIVNDVFKVVLEDDSINLNYETVSDDVEKWDSLTHIHIVVAIEKEFKIAFNLRQIRNWKNVGDICNSVIEK